MRQRSSSSLRRTARACEWDCPNVADRYCEVAYYPVVDSTQMRPDCDVFAAIPYLRGFLLSEAQVIYQPPTALELQTAGAIPVERLAGAHAKVPTITLSVEVGPCRNNFREVSPAASNSCSYLRAPERDGVDAIAELLQQGAHDTSDQGYWSEEYWKALEEEEEWTKEMKVGCTKSGAHPPSVPHTRKPRISSGVPKDPITSLSSPLPALNQHKTKSANNCGISGVGRRRRDFTGDRSGIISTRSSLLLPFDSSRNVSPTSRGCRAIQLLQYNTGGPLDSIHSRRQRLRVETSSDIKHLNTRKTRGRTIVAEQPYVGAAFPKTRGSTDKSRGAHSVRVSPSFPLQESIGDARGHSFSRIGRSEVYPHSHPRREKVVSKTSVEPMQSVVLVGTTSMTVDVTPADVTDRDLSVSYYSGDSTKRPLPTTGSSAIRNRNRDKSTDNSSTATIGSGKNVSVKESICMFSGDGVITCQQSCITEPVGSFAKKTEPASCDEVGFDPRILVPFDEAACTRDISEHPGPLLRSDKDSARKCCSVM